MCGFCFQTVIADKSDVKREESIASPLCGFVQEKHFAFRRLSGLGLQTNARLGSALCVVRSCGHSSSSAASSNAPNK
jgi:hypothetical protein